MPTWRDIPITLGADGLYHAKVSVGHKANGKLDRRHRSGKTVKEVQDKLRKLLTEVDAGRRPKAGKAPTVEQWFDRWLTDIAPYGARKLARRTLDDYRSRCRNWVYPHLGAIRLDAVEPEDLDRLYGLMYAKRPRPCSEGHVLKTHAVIRRGLEIALRRGKVARNVAKLLDPPGAAGVARESLSRDESRAVLAVAMQRRNGVRWMVGIAVGPRQGETLGLRWPDLDIDPGPHETEGEERGTVSIEWQLQRLGWQHGCDDPHACGGRPRLDRRNGYVKKPRGLHREPCQKDCTMHRGYKRGCPPPCPRDCTAHASTCPQRKDGGLVITRPKGWRRRPKPRVVALPPGLVRALRRHRAIQASERLSMGSSWHDHGLVFCHPDGRPIDPRVDYGEWQDILREAGVQPARVHVMRHSTATALLDLGVDISIVQEVLGHADIRTTRGYQDVTAEITRRAAVRMDGWLDSSDVTDLVTERRMRRSV